ncbi:MAG: biotin--[acetyl-CoA-carboxylase] ligase [Planctomycetota bacterium]|nr:biotin--[acetyl-CoA-carboxylase] ligase [Planctomycetota bacterium]
MLINSDQLLAATWIDRVEQYGEPPSTQDRARQAAESLPREVSLLVLAEQQTAGRGRGSNRWWTGSGSLAFSLLFDPARFGLPSGPIPQISMVTGVALVEVFAPLVTGQTIGLHWPNDVYIGSRKLAGILVDALPDGRHLIGLGANTNNSLSEAPEEVRQRAVSLSDLTGSEVEHGTLLAEFLNELAGGLSLLATAPAVIGDRFNSLCLQHGQMLTLRNGDSTVIGRCAGIAPDGALLLETASGREKFYAGTLH